MADPASLAQRASELAGDAGSFAKKLDDLSQQLTLRTACVGANVSKALQLNTPELRGALKAAGFLTRDSRVVVRS